MPLESEYARGKGCAVVEVVVLEGGVEDHDIRSGDVHIDIGIGDIGQIDDTISCCSTAMCIFYRHILEHDGIILHESGLIVYTVMCLEIVDRKCRLLDTGYPTDLGVFECSLDRNV